MRRPQTKSMALVIAIVVLVAVVTAIGSLSMACLRKSR